MKNRLLKSIALTLGLSTMMGMTQTANASSDWYSIKKGDTLYSISKKYGMTVDQLMKLNHLSSTTIHLGQKILISSTQKTSYDAMKVSVSLKTKNHYTFDKEEPGKYILQYKENGNYFVRIEVLDAKAKLSDVKKNAEIYIHSTGKVTEITPKNEFPFYKNISFFLHTYNSKVQQNVIVKKIDGKLVKFTIQCENREGSEGVYPAIMGMLQTIKLK